MKNKRRNKNIVNKKKLEKKIISENNIENTEECKNKIEDKKSNSILLEYYNYYKSNLMKKNIIIFIISIILFAVLLGNYISNLHNEEFLEQMQNISSSQQNIGFINNYIKTKLPAVFVIIFAGITPYFYISILGIFGSVQLVNEIFSIISVANHTGSMLFMCIGSIIQILGFSLSSSAGIHWCHIMTKRNRYYNGKENSVLDIRQEYYRLRNDTKKLEQLKKKKKEKLIKNEKNNVKIPYKALLISFLISSIIVFIGTMIFYI